ncbi:MAG: hypothetical protein ACI8XB_001452 [Patiriisocius sp.]|jgi:hypothetical protein
MLFNTSYKNDEYEYESNRLLGKSFSFLEKLKMRGAGSSRLVITELSPLLKPENMQELAINYASVELRPKGIVIHFSNRLDRYSWIVPYYRLVIFSTQTFSIHSNGKFIKFQKDKNYQANKEFIKKMTDLKNTFLNLQHYHA